MGTSSHYHYKPLNVYCSYCPGNTSLNSVNWVLFRGSLRWRSFTCSDVPSVLAGIATGKKDAPTTDNVRGVGRRQGGHRELGKGVGSHGRHMKFMWLFFGNHLSFDPFPQEQCIAMSSLHNWTGQELQLVEWSVCGWAIRQNRSIH